MNKLEIGRVVFAKIKMHLSEQGGSLAKAKFPPDFPISRRSCYNIRNGKWTVALLKKLPFDTAVKVHYQIKEE